MTAPRPTLGDVVALAALTATVAAATLYAAGWFYALRFFDQLGLGLLGLNLPHESVLLYGALALARHWMWLALITLAVIALRWGMRDWTGPAMVRAVGWPERAPLGLLAAIALLSALRVASYAAADADLDGERRSGFASRPAVELWPSGDPPAPPLTAALNSDCDRLLLRTESAVILLRPHRDDPGATLPVLIVPTDQIAALLLTRMPGPCP